MILFRFFETFQETSLKLKNLFKVFLAVFAQRAFDVVGKEVALVDVAANLAHPTTFAVLGFLDGLRLGFDVLLVVVVGDRGLVGKHCCIKYVSDKHGVRAEVNALVDTTCQIGVGVFRDV